MSEEMEFTDLDGLVTDRFIELITVSISTIGIEKTKMLLEVFAEYDLAEFVASMDLIET